MGERLQVLPLLVAASRPEGTISTAKQLLGAAMIALDAARLLANVSLASRRAASGELTGPERGF